MFVAAATSFFFGLIVGFNLRQPKKNGPKQDTSNLRGSIIDEILLNCQYKQVLPIKSDQSQDSPRLIICAEHILIDFPPTLSALGHFGEEDVVLDSVETFHDLFYWFNTGNDQRLPHYIDLTETVSGVVLVIEGVLSTGGSGSKATGIYYISEDSVKKIYEISESHPGIFSWAVLMKPEPITFKILTSIVRLGCGACLFEWMDIYEWDGVSEKLSLVNAKYPEEFQELYQRYVDANSNSCSDYTDKTLKEMYIVRKNKETVCADNEQLPAILPDQAKTFLQAMEGLKRILSGENLSYDGIARIRL